MALYVRNLRAGHMGLKRISLRLAAKGTPGDARPFRNELQAKHPEVLTAVERGWIEVLTHEEYLAHLGAGPVVAKPTSPAVVAPVPPAEPEPEPEPPVVVEPMVTPSADPEPEPAPVDATDRVPSLSEFKTLDVKDMAEVITEIGLEEGVSLRSKRKMVAAYSTWLDGRS